MLNSSTGTAPRVPSSAPVSMKSTGSSSKMAVVSSPLASAGVAGTATLSPGMCMNHASSVCPWVAPVPMPIPPSVRSEDGCGEQPLGIRGRRRHGDLESRDVHEPRFERLPVGCPRTHAHPTKRRSPDGDRRRKSPARHEPHLRGMVEDLVEGDGDQIDEHDLGNRSKPLKARSHGCTEDCRFRYRGVAYPIMAVLG